MKTRLTLSVLLLALTAGGLIPSCSSDEPKRKKVVGPDASAYSTQPWNRPRTWEATARSPLGAQGGGGGGILSR